MDIGYVVCMDQETRDHNITPILIGITSHNSRLLFQCIELIFFVIAIFVISTFNTLENAIFKSEQMLGD